MHKDAAKHTARPRSVAKDDFCRGQIALIAKRNRPSQHLARNHHPFRLHILGDEDIRKGNLRFLAVGVVIEVALRCVGCDTYCVQDRFVRAHNDRRRKYDHATRI